VTSASTPVGYTTERLTERITLYQVPAASAPRGPVSQWDELRYAWHSLRLCQLLLDRRRYDLSFAWPDWPAGGVSLLLKRQHGLPYLALVAADLAAEPARRRLWLDPLRQAVWREAAALTTLSPPDAPLNWPAVARRCLQLCQPAAPARSRPPETGRLSEDS